MDLVRFRIDLTPGCSLGPGKIALLEAIDKCGSLTRAAASLGMSYRYAWLLLNDLRTSFTESLTTASVGGRNGGGVQLTGFGAEVVRRYRAACKRIDAAARAEFAPIARKARHGQSARKARRGQSSRKARKASTRQRSTAKAGAARARSIKRAA